MSDEKGGNGDVRYHATISAFVAKPWPRSPFAASPETRSPRKWLIFRGPCGCGGWICRMLHAGANLLD